MLYIDARRQSSDDGPHRDVRSFVHRIAERSGGYGRESQGSDSVVAGDPDRFAVTTGERFGFVLLAASIHWADGVNYIFGRQSSTGGEDSFAGVQSADLGHDAPALLEDRGTAGAVNRSIHASAAEQR